MADLNDTLQDLPPYLTVMEVAALLRIGRSMAYDMARLGEIPVLKVGRVVRIPRDAFLSWLKEHEKQP